MVRNRANECEIGDELAPDSVPATLEEARRAVHVIINGKDATEQPSDNFVFLCEGGLFRFMRRDGAFIRVPLF